MRDVQIGREPDAGLQRLGGVEVDADRTERRRARLLRRSREDIGAPRDLEPGEPNRVDQPGQLCFQQSTGDSTGPEVDLLFRGLRDRLLDEDVADLQPSPRAQHSRHLA